MDLRARRADTRRVVGTLALLAGLLTSVLTMFSGSEQADPHVLAGLLVLVGVGLRLEAEIIASRA